MRCETQLMRGVVQCPACTVNRVGYPDCWRGFAIENMRTKIRAKKPKVIRRSVISDTIARASPAEGLK